MKLHDAIAASDTARDEGRELELILNELLAEHRQILTLVQAHREAISQADTAAIRTCVEQHGAALQRVQSIEKRRLELVSRVVQDMRQRGEPVRGQPTLTQIAARTAEPWRDRTVKLAHQLREVMQRVAREQGVVRAASESLLSHIDGLMKQVAQRLSHAGTYSGRGMVAPGRGQVVSGLDMTH
ncbi:MAG: flagellar export chaperone FlgN [Planctomycetota bacterium]